MAGCPAAPDLIVVGTTTAGMHTTERLLNAGTLDPQAYRRHAAGSVAEDLAARYGCSGPVLTVSTACSSGAVAIKIALEMLRAGAARRALVGGADSLCRLTYYGFNCLQLIDPQGARPLDRERRGMSVAEGAGMLLLTVDGEPDRALAEVLGAGLSCDAYHPAAPHPEGDGAYAAMAAALADSGVSAAAIDYINLHGTGTPDNDRAEARAVGRLFDARTPVSSIKGATGHSLAAAGAIEAVVAAICIREGLVPANTGLRLRDPEISLAPVTEPRRMRVNTVLSNSFGFGGNNAAVVIGAPVERDAAGVGAGRAPAGAGRCLRHRGGPHGGDPGAAARRRTLQGGDPARGALPPPAGTPGPAAEVHAAAGHGAGRRGATALGGVAPAGGGLLRDRVGGAVGDPRVSEQPVRDRRPFPQPDGFRGLRPQRARRPGRHSVRRDRGERHPDRRGRRFRAGAADGGLPRARRGRPPAGPGSG